MTTHASAVSVFYLISSNKSAVAILFTKKSRQLSAKFVHAQSVSTSYVPLQVNSEAGATARFTPLNIIGL